MTERVVDATRQGGGNAAPKRVQGGAPMSVDEALAYRESMAWRQFKPRADRAVEALADELARIRAALPDIIGCSLQPPQCPHDQYGWAHCCRVRLACIAHGLQPAVERVEDPGDGA